MRAAIFVALAVAIIVICSSILKLGDSQDLSSSRSIRNISGPIKFGASPAHVDHILFQFRGGDLRQGETLQRPNEVADIKEKWSSAPINLGLHSAARATPAVDETGVYVGADTGWFRKFDHDGNIVWSFFIETPLRGIHGTAALSSDTAFFGAYNGWFYALDKFTGKPRWAIELGLAIGASPLIFENDILISVETNGDGFVARLRATDGKLIWLSSNLGNQAHSSVTVDSDRNLAIVGTNARTLRAIDLKTGQTKWTAQTSSENKATGAIFKDLIIFASKDGTLYGIQTADGTQIWKTVLDGSVLGNVSIDEATETGVISTETGLYAFNAETGRLIWHVQYPADLSFSAAGKQTAVFMQAGPNKSVLAQCSHQTICVLNANSGEIENRFRIKANYSNMPVFRENRMYIAADIGDLSAYDLR